MHYWTYVNIYSGTCLIRHTKGPGKCVGLYRMSEYGVELHKFYCTHTFQCQNALPPPLFIEIIHTSVVLYIVGSHIGWNNALTLPHSPLYRNHTYICCVVYSWQPYWMEQCLNSTPLSSYRNHTYICCVVYSWQPYWMEQCLNPTPLPSL